MSLKNPITGQNDWHLPITGNNYLCVLERLGVMRFNLCAGTRMQEGLVKMMVEGWMDRLLRGGGLGSLRGEQREVL